MPSERLAAYLLALEDISEPAIHFACVEALKFCRFFPQVAELREFAYRYVPPSQANPPALFREDKPPDWERLGGKFGFSREEVAEMLEAGKEKQREHIAKLEADPEWRAEAQRLGGLPGLKPKETTVPQDLSERAQWATEKAAPWRKA